MVGLLPQFLDRNCGGIRDFAEILVSEVDIEPGLEVEVDFAVGNALRKLAKLLPFPYFLASAGFGAFRSSQ